MYVDRSYLPYNHNIVARLKRHPRKSSPASILAHLATLSAHFFTNGIIDTTMNNNRNLQVTAATTMPSQTYKYQAKRMLENSFPRVSCRAISAIFAACNCNFTLAFRQLSAVVSDESGDFDLISKNIKLFIKSSRPRKQFDMSNAELLAEVDNIPELNTKVPSTQSDGQKLYKYSCSLVRIPQGRVHMLCTYSVENEEMVHWMLLPLL